MASRLDQLSQLASQVPGLEQETNIKGKAARTALLQQQLGVAPATKQAVQQIGAQQAAVGAQQQVEAMGQAQQAMGAIGQQALQETDMQGKAATQRAAMGQEEAQLSARTQMARRLQNESLESRKRLSEEDIASAKRLQDLGLDVDTRLQIATQKQRKDLAKLGNGIKEELLDSRLAFEKDEMGRKFSNDRQMADYIAANAKNQQDFLTKMRGLEQVAKNEEVMMNAIRDRLFTIQKQGYLEKQGDLDAETNKQLAQMAYDAQTQAEKARAKVANTIAKKQAIGTVLGAVVGGVAGSVIPGAGTAVGASMGAGLGGAVGTLVR